MVVIVSAMSKVTDLLLETLRLAETGHSVEVEANLKKLEAQHVETCRGLLPEPACSTAICEIGIIISEFSRIAHGMLILGERPPKSVDEAVAVGERLSAMMLSEYLNAKGIHASHINSGEIVVTDDEFGNATPLLDLTRERATQKLIPLIEGGMIPVLTGFNGATVDGRPTTLGRGGSDFSASIIASVMDAAELWIWSDVDGIMTADPRLVKDAAVLERSHTARRLNSHTTEQRSYIRARSPHWSKRPSRSGVRTASTWRCPALGSCLIRRQTFADPAPSRPCRTWCSSQ